MTHRKNNEEADLKKFCSDLKSVCPKLAEYVDALFSDLILLDDDGTHEEKLTAEFRKHQKTCPGCQLFKKGLEHVIQTADMTSDCPTDYPFYHYELAKNAADVPLKLREHILDCSFCLAQFEYYRKKLEENPNFVPEGYPSKR